MQPRPPIQRSKTMGGARASHVQVTGKSPAGRNRSLKTSSTKTLGAAGLAIVTPQNQIKSAPHTPPKLESKNYLASKDKSILGDAPFEKPQAHALFILLDVNGDRTIDLKEWQVFHDVVESILPAGKIHDKGMLDLSCADQNGDGTVSAQEWNQYVDGLYEACGRRVWHQIGSDAIRLINAKREEQKQQANSKTEREHNALAWIETSSDWMSPCADGLVEFSKLQKDVLQRYFEMRDIDNSGALSLQEVGLVIDDIGRFPEHGTQDAEILQTLMGIADKDHSGGLEFNEFAGFLQAYYRSVYERIFFEHAGEDEQVMVSNIRPLLNGLCVAGFEVSCDDLEEMARRDADGILDFEEFCVLMRSYRDVEFEHLSKTAGFREAQAEVLLDMFNQADANGNGSVGIKESVPLIEKVQDAKLDHHPELLKNFARLFLRMDKDDTMSMDFPEFLSLLAVWTKEWNRKNRNAGGNQSSFTYGKKREDIEKAKRDARTFHIVSLCADFQMDAKGLEKEAKALRLASLGEDLENEVLALRWSLPISKVRALREGFEFIDLDGSGEVERGELNRLLGLLGCQAMTDLQKSALARCLDEAKKKGDLDFVGVVGVVQSYQAAVIQTILKANTNKDCSVPTESIQKVFNQAGQYKSKDQVQYLLEQCDIHPGSITEADKEMFSKLIESQNAKRFQDWEKSWGFSDDEVKRLHGICIKHGLSDEDGLEIDKVCGALEDMFFKGVAKAFRETMMKGLMRTGHNTKGMILFEEVLLVARRLYNRRNVEDSIVAEGLGLQPEAVDQLRDVFGMADKDKSGSVSYKEIKSVLSELGVVKTYKQREHMNLIAQDILGHEINKDDEEELSFGQFLRMLDQFEKTDQKSN